MNSCCIYTLSMLVGKRSEDLLTPHTFFFCSYHLLLPLSGCDQQDYSNACYAHSGGVSVAFEGKCSGEEDIPPEETEPIKCRHNDQCGEGEFCLLDMGMCDRKSGSGVCALIEDMCTFEYNPVW